MSKVLTILVPVFNEEETIIPVLDKIGDIKIDGIEKEIIVINDGSTDMETCYKLFRMEMVKKLTLKEKRFGFEPEITAKISKIPGIRIYKVGISYYGRTYQERKKVNCRDGIRAVYCIFKYNLFYRNPKRSRNDLE